MTIEQTLAAVVVGIFILIACAASGSSKKDPYKDPENMEVRTASDGTASIVNYKTEETIGTFSTRAEAEAFLLDLNERKKQNEEK